MIIEKGFMGMEETCVEKSTVFFQCAELDFSKKEESAESGRRPFDFSCRKRETGEQIKSQHFIFLTLWEKDFYFSRLPSWSRQPFLFSSFLDS